MATDRGSVAGVGKAQVALSTGSLYNWALDRVFELASVTGYDGVELMVDARMDSHDVGYLRCLCERWQIPILSVHTPFVQHVEGWTDVPEARVEQAVRLAEALGAATVVAHAPLRWQVGHLHVSLGGRRLQRLLIMPWESAVGARYARWLLEDLPALQAQLAVRIAIENMPAHRAWGRPIRLHRFTSVEELRRFPNLVLDSTHWGTCGVEPVEVYRALKEQVIHVHLSNYDGREHRMPAKGKLRLDLLLQEMGRSGFGGVIAVEVEPGAVAEGDWSEAHLRQALSSAAAEVRQHLMAHPSHSDNEKTTPSRTPMLGRAV